jgi:putative oxidoreductase
MVLSLDKKFDKTVATGQTQIPDKRERLSMSDGTNQIERLHAGFVRLMSKLQSPFLLLTRLYFGWQFATNGLDKLHNLPRIVEFFRGLGLPAPGFTATFVASFELIGGIFLALGLLSRITALGIVIDMSVAYLTADRDSLVQIFSNPDKFVGAAPFIFWFVGLLVLIFGPGKFALDTLIARSRHKNEFAKK